MYYMITSVRIPDVLRARIDERAKMDRVSRAEVILAACRMYLDSQGSSTYLGRKFSIDCESQAEAEELRRIVKYNAAVREVKIRLKESWEDGAPCEILGIDKTRYPDSILHPVDAALSNAKKEWPESFSEIEICSKERWEDGQKAICGKDKGHQLDHGLWIKVDSL